LIFFSILTTLPYRISGKPMKNSTFDRLAGFRRNRKSRNICLAIAGFSLLMLAVVGLDSLVSGTPVGLGYVFVLGVVFIISFVFAAYYHVRILSRD
jgi:hypothetical protein